MKYGGAAAVCGLAGGPSFPGSILPFILRGIAVYGIDSVMLPKGPREEAWRRLGTDLPLDKLDSTVSEVGLSDLMGLAPGILERRGARTRRGRRRPIVRPADSSRTNVPGRPGIRC